ncbi:MAG: hypothetical protein WAK13_04130, partial [Terriglobales bacterium]
MPSSRRHHKNTLIGGLIRLVCALALAVAPAAAQTLIITTADGHATTLSSAQIAASAHVSIIADDHGTEAKFEGVPLAAILSMAGVQLGDSLRGPRLAEVILVTAADGYKVAFALAEADPAFATRQIILADKRDGKPLGPK